MKILTTSLKGGVGKSSISTLLASAFDYHYITNDLSVPSHHNVTQIEPNKKRIPAELLKLENVIYDFGALSTHLDAKVSHALNYCDLVIVPTRPDPRSIEATIETVKLIQGSGKPIVIIVNDFRDSRAFDNARDQLINQLGRMPIFWIKHTTLFDRISRDGIDWYSNIDHAMGEYQLRKTNNHILRTLKRVLRYGAKNV